MLLHYIDSNSEGETIVLLHGMSGSARYWQNFTPYLPKSRRIVALDLLGFGLSPKPKNIIYNYETHLESIIQTLKHIGVCMPLTLVGHSMGGLLALRLAAKHPDLVKKLVLIAAPIYETPHQAHLAITQSSKLKELAYYGFSSRILCNTWCRFLRPISTRLAPIYLPHLSELAAKDSVLHTWQSYSQSMENVIENQSVSLDISAYNKPVILVYGSADSLFSRDGLKNITDGKVVKLHIFRGNHQIIDQHPLEIANIILY